MQKQGIWKEKLLGSPPISLTSSLVVPNVIGVIPNSHVLAVYIYM